MLCGSPLSPKQPLSPSGMLPCCADDRIGLSACCVDDRIGLSVRDDYQRKRLVVVCFTAATVTHVVCSASDGVCCSTRWMGIAASGGLCPR